MTLWATEIKELESLYTSLKGRFPELEKEFEQLIETKDANVVMLYSRRCLEIIVSDLCESELKRPRKTEPLKGIIDKLHHEEKIPEFIITSMHGLNDLATFGAHPKEFDPQQVRPVLINLTTIIKWYLKYKDSKTISDLKTEGKRDEIKAPFVSKEIIRKSKLSLILLLSGILVVVVIIAYPKIFRQDRLEKLRSSGERISLAVMPFQNMTNDTTWNVWQDGIQNNLITSLSNTEELQVRQIESIYSLLQSKGFTSYASITPSVASKISQKLDANVYIYGSINQAGDIIRVNAQLNDSKTEETFKSFQIDGTSKKILYMIDSLSVMIKNFLLISKLEKVSSPEFQVQYVTSTNSPEAYSCFIQGQIAYYKFNYSTAIDWYLQALAIDSNLIGAMAKISFAYSNQGKYEQGKDWCLRYYRKLDMMTVQQKLWANYQYAVYFKTLNEAITYLRQLKDIDDQQPLIYYGIGDCYLEMFQYDKAIPEFEKALEIYHKWDTKPLWSANYAELGIAYHKTGQYKKEKKLYKKAEQDFPDDPNLIEQQAWLSLTEGDTIAVNRYIEKWISLREEQSWSNAQISIGLGVIYSMADIPEKQEEYYRQALLLEPENPERMNSLAYFLIDKDRNINEGLELIDRALKLRPDNYSYLHTKGWGLYKQGKYKEALELLERSWSLRPIYRHLIYLHLEEVKKAIANQNNN